MPKLNNSPYDWEIKIANGQAVDKDEAIDEIENDFNDNFKGKLAQKQKGILETKNRFLTEFANQAPKVEEQPIPPIGEVKPQIDEPMKKGPPKGGPKGAPKGMPSPPTLGEKTEAQKKRELDQQKEQARKKALEDAKKAALQAVKDINDDVRKNDKEKERALSILRKNAEEALKDTQKTMLSFKNEAAYPGGPSRDKLHRERDDTIKGIHQDITSLEALVKRFETELKIISKNPKLTNARPKYEEALKTAKSKLSTLTSQRDDKLSRIQKSSEVFEQRMKELQNTIDLQKATLQTIGNLIDFQKQNKAAAQKSPDALLNDAFASKFKEFSKLEHYSVDEQILIRDYFYKQYSEKGGVSADDNPITWDTGTFQLKFSAAIQLQKLKHVDLKKLVNRNLFEDETNPNIIAKPPQISSDRTVIETEPKAPIKPPPPLPGNAGPVVKSPAQLKREAEQQKQAAQGKALENARSQAQNLVDKSSEKEVANLRKQAESTLKTMQNELAIFTNEAVYPGGPSRLKLFTEREETIKGIDKEISEKQATVNRLQKELKLIEGNPKLGKVKDNFKKAFELESKELATLKSTRESRLSSINQNVALYEQKVGELERKINVQKATTQVFVNAIDFQKQQKAIKDKSPEARLNDAFASRFKEFSQLKNYSIDEKILLRDFFFDKGANTVDDNALMWDDKTFQLKFSAAIQLQKIKHTDLKKMVGRNLFEDENNPTNIAAPKSTSVASTDAVNDIGDDKVSPTTDILAPFIPPSAPQKAIAHEETAMLILKNILSSIDIKTRYERAGSKKSFISQYLKMQDRSRPEQIKMLSAATQNAAKEFESLIKLKANLDKSGEPLSEDSIKERVNSIFSNVEGTMNKIEKQMADAGHKKKGTSRMENVIEHLRNEISQMKSAVGIEAPKEKQAKKMK